MSTNRSKQSAAQRRAQQRQQRDQRIARGSGNKRRYQRKSNALPWFLVGGAVVIIAIIIVVFVVLSRQSQAPTANKPSGTQDQAVLQAVSNVNPQVFDAVGTGGVQNPFHPVANTPILKGPTGKPEFFYAGGEFCPYCAAQRWGIVVALSRFGKFTSLPQIQSYENNISTFSFYGSQYSSNYIDFVPVETAGNEPASGGGYVPLQTPTAQQQQLINTYDAPPYTQSQGNIPFIDIANQQVTTGASYNPQTIMGSSWQSIANALSDKNASSTQGIVGTANYLTAAICMTTNQQPGNVCNSSTIQQIEKTIGGHASLGPGAPQVSAPLAAFDINTRRLNPLE